MTQGINPVRRYSEAIKAMTNRGLATVESISDVAYGNAAHAITGWWNFIRVESGFVDNGFGERAIERDCLE